MLQLQVILLSLFVNIDVIIRAVTTDPTFSLFIGNSDFDSMSIMQTFMASSTGRTLCVNITIIDDTIYEGDEQFLVTFGNNLPDPSLAGVGPITQACVTIQDDDGQLVS